MPITQDPPKGVRLPRRERRAQLLDAARSVFVTQGFHAAAMDEIAVRAGVSKPVLYQHFPSKQELYLALLDESIETLVGSVRDALQSTEDNAERVAAAIGAYFDFVDDPDGAYRLVFESDLVNVDEVRRRVERTDEHCSALVAVVIVADTGLSEDEAMLLATGLTGMAQTSARRWLRNRRALPKSTATKLVVDQVWGGISAFPKSHPRTPPAATGPTLPSRGAVKKTPSRSANAVGSAPQTPPA
jgi:AcrR family transcriptional regulator